MNALVVSLKFNPGHFSHLVANYKLFEDLGYEPCLLVNEAFKTMDEENRLHKICSLSEIDEKYIKTTVFWFPSLKNISHAILLKARFKSQIVYVYHEPFDSIANYHKGGFGPLKIFRVWLINLVNLFILTLSNCVILPSEGALKLYEKKYKWINKNFQLIPLLFSDELKEPISPSEKKYIAYIGTVAEDHAFDEFVRFAIEAMKNGWFQNERFLIATGSKLKSDVLNLLQPFITEGKLVVQHGSFMSNPLINSFYRDSTVVWNAYHRSMQSGVLPKAYMFGTPVLVLKKNATAFVNDHQTGILIEDNNDHAALRTAVDKIVADKKMFYEHCRNKFLDTFFYEKYLANFKNIIN